MHETRISFLAFYGVITQSVIHSIKAPLILHLGNSDIIVTLALILPNVFKLLLKRVASSVSDSCEVKCLIIIDNISQSFIR